MSELFEAIYFDCSTDIGLEDQHKDLLAKPLENKLFERIFREAHLREMAVVNINRFIDHIVVEIRKIVLTEENKQFWKLNWNNRNELSIFKERLSEEIQQIVMNLIENNDKPHITNPFVVMNENGSLLIFKDSNEVRLNAYIERLNRFVGKRIGNVTVRNIVRINESIEPPDEIRSWVRNGLRRIQNSITGLEGASKNSIHKGHVLLPANFSQLLERVFIDKYKNLQGLDL